MNDQIKEERISWQNLLHLLVCSKGRLFSTYWKLSRRECEIFVSIKMGNLKKDCKVLV